MEVVKDICCLDGASYKNAKSFYHHIKTKHPSIVNPEYSGPRYECNLCSKKFVTQKALTNHLNRDKHAETIYMCENLTRKQHVFSIVLPKFIRQLTR